MRNRKYLLVLMVLTVVLLILSVSSYSFNIEPHNYALQKKSSKQINEVSFELINKVPVLMYHAISNVKSELCVDPNDFAKQMKYLYENGYSPITLSELYGNWNSNLPLPSKPIVLSFDDGYQDNYDIAFKEMKKYDFKGVLFIYADKFNRGNSVSVSQVKEMADYGWEIGNHSYNHKELPRVNDKQLNKETMLAKEKIESLIGVEIVSFCYPSGKYDNRVIKAVESSGHKIAVTTNYGYSKQEQGIFTLSRVRINRSDRVNGYIRKIS